MMQDGKKLDINMDFGYFSCYWWVYPVLQSPFKIVVKGLRG
jgi:hypothetical protein